MASVSRIEWTDATWNPVRGCTKISPGCKFCYAEVFSERWRGVPGHPYEDGFDLRTVPEALELPLQWRKPKLIFVNSMSDLFHVDVSEEYIQKVFEVMTRAPQHTFQVLTKRSDRLRQLAPNLPWPPNVWIGVSVEDRKRAARVADLVTVTQARVRFLSVEPLLEALSDLPLDGIDWVIVGGESGSRPRPIKEEWVVDIRDQCDRAGVPFFFKQWGGRNKKLAGRELKGKIWSQMPRGWTLGEPAAAK